jgi:hypothetical protein
MNLDEAQRKQVAQWVASGHKLSEIQNRLDSELGIRLTYMDVRLLVDDLKLTPKDPEPAKPLGTTLSAHGPGPSPAAAQAGRSERSRPEAAKPPAGTGTISLSVDQLARSGALVSGKVTFSDGQPADWYLDQSGRFGLMPRQTGYRPSAADLQQLQMKLESELARMGF